MCEYDAIATPIGKTGKVSVDCVCEISGKPITVSNKYGTFCEDMCQLQENKDAHDLLSNAIDGCGDDPMQMLDNLMNMFKVK